MDPVTAKLLDYGLTGLILLIGVTIHLKFIRPDNQRRELERDKLMSDRLQSVLDQLRQKENDHAIERASMRKDHAESWELQRKQSREDRDLAREERQADRDMFKEMIIGLTSALDKLNRGQDRNFAATLALGEGFGRSKKEMARRTEVISQQPVDPRFTLDETQH